MRRRDLLCNMLLMQVGSNVSVLRLKGIPEAIHLHARSTMMGESWVSQVVLASPMTS